MFTDARETDDMTGHLLGVIDKQREENEELSAEVERLQITIRRLRMDIDQRDTRIVAILGNQTTVPTVMAAGRRGATSGRSHLQE